MDSESQKRSDYHLRYGDSLTSLGILRYTDKQLKSTIKLLSQAAVQHASAQAKEKLCYDYFWLERSYSGLGLSGEAKTVHERMLEKSCDEVH